MGEGDVTRGLPADLVSVLRDHSVLVSQDVAVFELVAAWAKAPTPTASADSTATPGIGLFEELYRQTTCSSTTTAGRY